ncbi:MAG: C10 family peptidase [Bacteroidaceae bacterium]|nr:C10 family peptidase [Bacteroidaceae bacterium]
MMKKVSIMMVAFAVFSMANAQPLSMQQALQNARQFMPDKQFMVQHGRRIGGMTEATTSTSCYIFNADNHAGFVIVAGDERAEEILGYSDTGSMDVETLPENVRWWLKGYADAIEAMQQQALTITRKMEENRASVRPLLKTQWGQGTPYNDMCPTIGDERCVTGCVATAVAQLMKYYNHPKSSKATFQYRTSTNKITMRALPATDFDWDNMQNAYYYGEASAAQQEAVATLMLYCGCALSMDYDVGGSGADDTPVCDAMEYFFDYDEGIRRVYRQDYDADAWDGLIYDELANGYPVFYSGRTSGNEGHAFVCDGYDNGFFHINWGWNGYCDGYFKLSILYPYAESYDSTEYGEGYSLDQMAVINIVPKDFQGFADGVRHPIASETDVPTIYTLSGQRLSSPQRGFQIINGKKVWIK